MLVIQPMKETTSVTFIVTSLWSLLSLQKSKRNERRNCLVIVLPQIKQTCKLYVYTETTFLKLKNTHGITVY